MRVAYVITRADAVGGATIHVRDLASALARQGHEVCVFVGGSAGPVVDQMRSVGVRVVPIPQLGRAVNPARDAVAYLELRRALREFAPNLISAHTAKAGWLGRAAARSLGIPCVYTPHGWVITDRISRAQGALYTVAERVAAPWADAIVCVSESERELGLRVAPREKLHVIHNGVRDVALRANPAGSPPTIVSVARFEAPKDHTTLLDAVGGLGALEWSLELVGDGALEAEIRERAGSRVRFAGYQREPATELAAAQIFVLASRSEGFPRSILEAMRAGLPVVASDVGGVREAVIHGETGLVVPAGDVGALQEALQTLIKSPSDRQRMGTAGRLRYEEGFTFERMLTNTSQLYATIVGVNP